jgi:light-regulated signal transduction histidine kinase (bacteriophytochrome)
MDKRKELNVAIVGGGPGCKAIIEMVSDKALRQLHMNLMGVADVNPSAVGFQYAKEKGIFTTHDYRDLFRLEGLNLLIELTGREEVADEIVRSKPYHIRLMDHVAARLFWDVIQIKEEVIQERERGKRDLMEAYDQLESIVQARTAKLEKLSEELTEELNERHRIEQALRKSEEKSRQLGMDLAVGLSEVFDALGEISSGNPEVRISEDSDLELIAKLKRIVNLTAKNLGEIVDLSHEFAIGLAEHFDTLDKVSKGDLTARVSGTSKIELIELLGKMTNRTIDSVSKEISRRKLAEGAFRDAHMELLKKAGDLQSVNEELSQYDHVVAHVLKAPLRAIHHYADFLRHDLRHLDSSGHKESLNGLTKAVLEGVELVDDLLEFSMVGRRVQSPKTIEPDVFFEDVFASLHLPEDVEVVMGNSWPIVLADTVLLKRIFQDLIKNATKFNHSKPKRVEIGWQPGPTGQVELFVQDNGIGIHPRYHDQIFGVFERLHGREDYEGTGLGLAIVKKAVTRMGGSIRIESTPGRGTTFFVSVPESTRQALAL